MEEPVLPGLRGPQALKEAKVGLASPVPQARQDQRGYKVLLALKALVARPALEVKMDFLVSMALLARRVIPVFRELLAHRV